MIVSLFDKISMCNRNLFCSCIAKLCFINFYIVRKLPLGYSLWPIIKSNDVRAELKCRAPLEWSAPFTEINYQLVLLTITAWNVAKTTLILQETATQQHLSRRHFGLTLQEPRTRFGFLKGGNETFVVRDLRSEFGMFVLMLREGKMAAKQEGNVKK